MKIVKLLRALSSAAPKDDPRQPSSVYFERKNILEDSGQESTDVDKNHIKIVITNGFYIMKVETSPLFFPSLQKDGESALFHRETLIKTLKAMKSSEDIVINLQETGTANTTKNYLINERPLGEVHHGRFPAWQRPWVDANTRRYADITHGIGMNMKLLGTITSVLSSVTSQASNALVTFGESGDAIAFEFNGKSFTEGLYRVEACLMPTRL
jgi:hypothetical protein